MDEEMFKDVFIMALISHIGGILEEVLCSPSTFLVTFCVNRTGE